MWLECNLGPVVFLASFVSLATLSWATGNPLSKAQGSA
jgi:hypothetical protein